MTQFLNNSGFYNSKITHEIVLNVKKKQEYVLNMSITLSEPYRIKNFEFVTMTIHWIALIPNESIKTKFL